MQKRLAARAVQDAAAQVVWGGMATVGATAQGTEESVMKTFAKQVQDARQLLDFAITEGIVVTDQTIRTILETEDYLSASSATSEQPKSIPLEQRVTFHIAYRDLLVALDPITRDSLFLSFRLLRYVWLAVLVIFAVLLIAKNFNLPFLSVTVSNFTLLLFGLAISFSIWFCDIFTGDMTKRRLIEIVLFCYVFTIFCMSILVYPIFFGEDDKEMYRLIREGPIGLVKGCGRESADDWIAMEVRCGVQDQHSAPSQWVFNVGGTLRRLDDSADLYEISGGVIVPIYVLFLSFMGAVVNMTRRVPEYQRRIYLPDDAPGSVSREEGRELLIFQIMQVVSAPLIAITTYYIVKSESITTSVLISFGSGFASEVVLRTISALVSRINNTVDAAPASANEPPARPVAAVRSNQGLAPQNAAVDGEVSASNGSTAAPPALLR